MSIKCLKIESNFFFPINSPKAKDSLLNRDSKASNFHIWKPLTSECFAFLQWKITETIYLKKHCCLWIDKLINLLIATVQTILFSEKMERVIICQIVSGKRNLFWDILLRFLFSMDDPYFPWLIENSLNLSRFSKTHGNSFLRSMSRESFLISCSSFLRMFVCLCYISLRGKETRTVCWKHKWHM